jgi:hypothetical protein
VDDDSREYLMGNLIYLPCNRGNKTMVHTTERG